MIHSSDVDCPGCKTFLFQVHPQLVVWFYWLVDNHPGAHIAKGWRGEEEQNEDVAEGRSKLSWPNSKHNMLDEQGNPCSQALDIFQLESGKALFDKEFFKQIDDENKTAGFPIKWGGTFPHFPDYDHFELTKGDT